MNKTAEEKLQQQIEELQNQLKKAGDVNETLHRKLDFAEKRIRALEKALQEKPIKPD